MSTLQKGEPHDHGGYPPSSSHPQVVEVVEMRDVHETGDDKISRGLGFKTEGKPKTQLRALYDKGERQRKVSKYQSKKKVQPKTPSVSSEDTDLKIKTEELTAVKPLVPAELWTENDVPDTSDSSFDEGVHTVSATAVECGTEASEGVQSDHQCSSDARCSGANPFDLGDQTEEELLYGDGEDCSDLDMMEDEYSDDLFAENCPEMNTHSLKDDYEDISVDSASEDSGRSEDEADSKIKRSVRSPLKGSSKFSKPASQMLEDDGEGKQTSQTSTSDSKTKVSPRMPRAESGTKIPVQNKSTSLSKASVGVKTYDKSATIAQTTQSSPQKLIAVAKKTSPNTSQTSTVSKTPVSSLQAKSKNSVISPIQSPSTSKVSEPVASASGLSAIKRTINVAISSKSDSTETNKRSLDYSSQKVSKSADTFLLDGSSKNSITVTSSKTDTFFSSELKYNHSSSSSVLSQMDCPLMEREILPGIQTSGRLGLSSHTGTDWNMEEMEEVSADEDDEDSDVLSLYEYDTFLENEEEQEQWGHGTALSMRSISKDGESCLHLTPEENFSISVSDKSERRVSRPHSKERNENETRTAVQNDSKEKSETAEEGKDKETPLSVPKPQVRETQSFKPEGGREHQGVNDDHKFQKPNLPSPKVVKNINQASSKPGTRPVKTGLFAKPASVPQRGLAEGRNDKYRQSFQARGGLGGRGKRQMGPRASQKTQAIPPFQRIPQHRLEEMKKELEAELKYFVEKKSIFEATETVGKIHQQESMKIERGLVLNLLHWLIREGAVPQLMRIFTFVCNQGLFNPEVCNAYIRLGCAEGNKYDRQLKNIFQYLRRHSIQPAGDCIISLLSLYSEHTGDPAMFWFMLSYFDTFPGFVVPVPLLERAIRSLLQHKDRGALSKFNQWVLTTKTESVLQKLNLALIGRMAASMLPASRSRVQKIISNAQKNEGDELKKDFSSPVDTTLVIPSNFTDQDYCFYSRRIQDCGTQEDMDLLAETYVELCRRSAGHNRCLLKDYIQVLLQKNVVDAVDMFLHALYNAAQQERSQGAPVDADKLALAHLLAFVLEHVCFNHHADVTLGLLEVITQCPLVVKTLLMNCWDVGLKMMAVCLRCQQPSRALDILKALHLQKNDEQGVSLMKDLLRQLVAVRDIPSAVTALKVAAVQEVMGIADIGLLAAQLMWHSLNIGDVKVALELQDLTQRQSSSSPAPQLPAALLRALLVACSLSGYSGKAVALFEELKRRRVYNAEALGARPYVFQVSTMLTPTEIQCCVLDRLKELHLKLCSQIKLGRRLGPMDKGLAVKLVSEHDPQVLALPFLALAPRSLEQAMAVVAEELATTSPPLQAAFDQQIQLLVLEPGSLVAHLQSYPTPGVKQGLVWEEDDPPQSSPPAVRGPPSLPPFHPASGAGRQFSPPLSHPPSRLQGPTTGRQLPVSQSTGHPKPLVPGDMHEPIAQPALLLFPKRGGPDKRHLPAQRAPLLPLPEAQNPGEGQLPVSQMAGNPFPKPADSGGGRYVPESHCDAHLHPRLEEGGRKEVPEPWNIAQPSFQQVDSLGMHLPEPSVMPRHPHQPTDGRQLPMPVDIAEPSYQPKDFTRRHFPEQQSMTRSLYKPAVVQNQAPMSFDAPPPLVQPGDRPGRQMSSPPPSRPQPSQQPCQQMKRRSSVPPKQQPAAQSQHFKVPLLPTPEFHPDKRPGMPDVELSEELPPKKMRMSPPDRPFAGGRRPAPDIQQTRQRQQLPQPSPALQMPQSPMHGDTGHWQQLSRDRGMPLPSDRYRKEKHSPEFFSQVPGGQFVHSSRDALPPSTQTMRQPTPQNSGGITQPLQQFPPEDMGHLPPRSSQSNRQFTQQASEDFGQQYHEKQEPLSTFNPRGRQTTEEPGHLPRRSIQQNSWHASQQNTRSVSQSQQQFTGDGDKLPTFPPRFDEQRWNSSAQMGKKDEVMIQEMGPEDTDRWQDRPRFGQQPQGAQPWGDAPLYDEGEDLSWHSRLPVNAHSFVPTDQATERFSHSETTPDPFRHPERFHKPVYQMRGSTRGRGRPPYRGRKQ